MFEKNKSILGWIRQILAPLGPEDGGDDRSFALNIVALGGLALSVVTNGVMLVRTVVVGDGSVVVSVFMMLCSAFWFVSIYWLSRQGKADAASHLFLWGAIALILLGHMPDPKIGPSDPIWQLLNLAVIGASLLLGTGWSFAFAVIGILLYLVSPSIKQTYAPSVPSVSLYRGIMMGATMLASAVFVWLFRDGLEKALHRLQRQAGELEQYQHTLEQRMTAEQEQRQQQQDMVEMYVGYMAQVAQGHLDVRIPVDENERGSDDPLIALGRSLNDTVVGLQQMTTQIRETAHNLDAASSEILSATMQQASGTIEKSAAISQTSIAVDEVMFIAEQSVARAQEVAGASQRAVNVSRTGRQAVEESIGSMREIKMRVEGIAENILALSEQTLQIGKIITTVNDLSAQSNILALNASVEAARAGEYGKGFAVVAVEVRNLAEQSRQATAQVRAILSDVHKATNATVIATEEGTKGVEQGARLAERAQQAIDQLYAVIEESAQAAAQVMADGQEQMIGVEHIAIAMKDINQATVQSLDNIRQTERAARNLDDLAGSLTEAVAQYQL